MNEALTAELELEMASAALLALAEHGIPVDTQELLVRGSLSRGISPGALSKAIQAVLLVARARPSSQPPDSFRRIYDKMQRGKVSEDERAKS